MKSSVVNRIVSVFVVSEQLTDERDWIWEMLHHFEGSDRGVGCAGPGFRFETPSGQVRRVLVRPVEVEADVAHQAGENSIASGRVEKTAAAVEEEVEHHGGQLSEIEVAPKNTGVRRGDRTRISLFEPVRVLRLQYTAVIAKIEAAVVFAEHFVSERQSRD